MAWPGFTPVGRKRDRRAVENLRDRGVIRRAEDLGIDPRTGHARPARRALDQGTRALVGRPVPSAGALSQLVMETLEFSLASQPLAEARGRRRCAASSAPATSKC